MQLARGYNSNEYLPLLNPIIFAETNMKHFLIKGLRKFQKEILNCKDKQVVLRIGRRCGKTICLAVKAIFEAITNENYRVVIITPGRSHYDLIYEAIMNKLIMPNPELKACVVRTLKSPGKIWFSSGSTISFFTAGTKSGSGALAVRGQGAELVIMDEADYLSAVDIEAILALKLEHPNITMWASSTPTGKRSFFYKWCTERNRGWREFHYSSPDANPDWNAEMELFAKTEYPGEAYRREILAEFGKEDAGVFNKAFIDIACERGIGMYNNPPLYMPHYGYLQAPTYDAVRTIGVDWDKYGAPTNIIVLERLNEVSSWVANRIQVPQSEFTLINAVNTLIKVNQIWKPGYIYIDKGFGEMQAELLKMHGKKNKDTMLHKIVKPISFSSKISVVDPVDGTIDKKEAKHLMVNMLQKSIEESRIIFNQRDDVMVTQFIGYAIKGYSSTGKPIYKDEDDHTVAALGLANLAMMQNYDELFQNHSQVMFDYQPEAKYTDVKYNNKKYLSDKDFAMDKVNPAYNSGGHTYKRFTHIKFPSREGVFGKRTYVGI